MKDPRVATEEQIHCSIADLLRFKGHPNLIWWHTPNGELRTGRTGVKLKRMGVIPGVPDFCLVLPDGRAAFLEVKSATGRLSPEQKAFAERCAASGAVCTVVRSSREAETYLGVWGALNSPVSRQEAA